MKLMLISPVVATLMCAVLTVETSAEQIKTVPIMLHPDEDHGTCSIGLRVNLGGAAVRSGPGLKYPVIARLKAGHVVSGCNENNGWDGIIDGQDETCSVGVILSAKRPYSGACISGWVNKKRLTSIYG